MRLEVVHNRRRVLPMQQNHHETRLCPVIFWLPDFLPRPSEATQPEPAGQSRASYSEGEAFILDDPRAKATLSSRSRQPATTVTRNLKATSRPHIDNISKLSAD